MFNRFRNALRALMAREAVSSLPSAGQVWEELRVADIAIAVRVTPKLGVELVIRAGDQDHAIVIPLAKAARRQLARALEDADAIVDRAAARIVAPN